MQTYGEKDRNEKLPHLEYNANTTQFDIILDKVVANFNHSRFALEIIMVTTENNTATTELHSTHTIDDEHSPGIFEVCTIIIVFLTWSTLPNMNLW